MSDMENKFSDQWSVVSGRGAEKGFSLIEVLIITAIIGVLTTIAVMNFSGIIDSYKARGAASHLYSDMQLARLTAIKGGRAWCVIFNGSPFTSYRVVDSGADGICNAGDTVNESPEKSVEIASEYNVSDLTHNFGATNSLNFNPNGTANGGTVTVTKGSKTIRVTVSNNTGSVRIQ